jgi:26S proteasome regulatory subunit N3
MVEKMEVDEPTQKSGSEDGKKEDKKEEKPAEDLNLITYENLREWCNQLERGEIHVVGRVLQFLSKTRKQLNTEILVKLCNAYLSSVPVQRDLLLSWLPQQSSQSASLETPMEVDVRSGGSQKSAAQRGARSTTPRRGGQTTASTPEVELYVHLLVLLYLIDQKKYDVAAICSRSMIARADIHEKRSLDAFLARAFFYLALISERTGKITEIAGYFNGRLRMATLRHQSESQATIIVCLLRAYLLTKQLVAAAKLVRKVTFPENANNNDLARFLYYQGRIKALQLDYVSAAGFFQQALRKAPQDSAIGFKQNVQKWVVVISLLQGEIPERSVFRIPIYRKPLSPYLDLSHAVRLGDLAMFSNVLDKYSNAFEKDHTLTLIVRLRQNVIKTAIRQISLAYSRITLKDIAKKLQLPTDAEAEYMVAKAIKDGTIDAAISFDTKTADRYMQSSEADNIYRTVEPQFAYDSRIKSCLELHNLAVKALRYPSDKKNASVESIEQQRERELMELEFAKEMADEDDDY